MAAPVCTQQIIQHWPETSKSYQEIVQVDLVADVPAPHDDTNPLIHLESLPVKALLAELHLGHYEARFIAQGYEDGSFLLSCTEYVLDFVAVCIGMGASDKEVFIAGCLHRDERSKPAELPGPAVLREIRQANNKAHPDSRQIQSVPSSSKLRSKCQHGRRQDRCTECRGSAICEHRRRRSRCKDCGGGGLCQHGRERYGCKDCGGKGICLHGRQLYLCKPCGGRGICMHGLYRVQCKRCGGTALCPHSRKRSQCKECGGKGLCSHGRQRSKCKHCAAVAAPARQSGKQSHAWVCKENDSLCDSSTFDID